MPLRENNYYFLSCVWRIFVIVAFMNDGLHILMMLNVYRCEYARLVTLAKFSTILCAHQPPTSIIFSKSRFLVKISIFRAQVLLCSVVAMYHPTKNNQKTILSCRGKLCNISRGNFDSNVAHITSWYISIYRLKEFFIFVSWRSSFKIMESYYGYFTDNSYFTQKTFYKKFSFTKPYKSWNSIW